MESRNQGPPTLYTLKEAQAILKVGKNTILELIHTGRLRAVAVGPNKGFRVLAKDLELFLAGATFRPQPNGLAARMQRSASLFSRPEPPPAPPPPPKLAGAKRPPRRRRRPRERNCHLAPQYR